jgi:hypothetical protein
MIHPLALAALNNKTTQKYFTEELGLSGFSVAKAKSWQNLMDLDPTTLTSSS